MFFYIIRHGRPDYATDTLLPDGIEQAKLAAKRLSSVPIDAIYASPMGRAQETAQALSEVTGLPVQTEDWAYELCDESRTTFPDGEKKLLSTVKPQILQSAEVRLLPPDAAFTQIDAYVQSGFPDRYKSIAQGLDDLLARNGYSRTDDGFYHADAPNDRHICLFCHGGMLRVLLSHMLNIPVQLLSATLMVQFTGITVLYFRTETESVCPMLVSVGDTGHLYYDGVPQKHYCSQKEY